MEFRERLNYYFINKKDGSSEAKFKINKPDVILNNLDKKKIRIQKFYVNNRALPQFIPQRITQNTTDYFNVTTNATTTNKFYDTLDINSLEYYIILRDQANTEAIVVFLKHIPINPTPTPQSVINDDVTYYSNKYYYYYDFTYFLELVRDAYTYAYTQHSNSNAGNVIGPILWQNTQFQFFVRSYSQWYFEMSESLINILPFKNILTSDGHYRLIFDDTPANINGLAYNEVDAKFYDTIFPFTELLFKSDDAGLNPISFIDNTALTSNTQNQNLQNTILSFDIDTNAFNEFYNFYKYVNKNDTEFVNFDKNKDTKQHLTIQLFLRLSNDVVIPYILNKNERCKFTLEVKYENK